MGITANQSMEAKEPWWKAITSFWSISKNDAEESEINAILKQQNNKHINELEEKHSGKEEPEKEENNSKNRKQTTRKEISKQSKIRDTNSDLRTKENIIKEENEITR